ncbi:MAG: hypothetical protein ACTSVI_13745 [Promethearchaeota archaeon]
MPKKNPKKKRESKVETSRAETSKKGGTRTCNIKDCNKPAVRSLSRQEYETYMKDAGLELKSRKERKIYPCAEHYKMIKKKKKKDDKINRIRFNARVGAGKVKGNRY